MALMNSEAALKVAKEFTTTALEHSFIKSDPDPKQAAANLATFYRSLVEELRNEG